MPLISEAPVAHLDIASSIAPYTYPTSVDVRD